MVLPGPAVITIIGVIPRENFDTFFSALVLTPALRVSAYPVLTWGIVLEASNIMIPVICYAHTMNHVQHCFFSIRD